MALSIKTAWFISHIGLCSGVSLAAAGAALAAPSATDMTARYARAEAALRMNTAPLVLNATITPHWREGARDRFTYRRELGDGRAAFIEIDAATGKARPAFDAGPIAAGLAAAQGKPADAERLPFMDYDEVAGGIGFADGGRRWQCETARAQCKDVGAANTDPFAVASPDGRWLAYVVDGDLWVRSLDGAEKFALTTDGERGHGYAGETQQIDAENAFGEIMTPPGAGNQRRGPFTLGVPTSVIWSPDSTKLYSHRIDERGVREISITQHAPTDGTIRPITWTFPYAMAEDPVVPMAESWIFDLATRSGRKVALPPQMVLYFSSVTADEAWWTPDSTTVNLLTRSRYAKDMALHRIDAATGAVRTPITETGKTYVEIAAIGERPMTQVLANGDILWWSEKSGFGHLSLLDGRTGALKRQLTSGEWMVRNILKVDERAGVVYIAGIGREPGDPYLRNVYSVRLSDGKTTLLTRDDANHHVLSAQEMIALPRPKVSPAVAAASNGFSPSGRYFLDEVSRLDRPTEHVLRSADGREVATIDKVDVSRLDARGWSRPERFSALAADGKTMLYGTMWKPADFDVSKRYALLDHIYPGPQLSKVSPGFSATVLDVWESQSLAELGMIVISVDGRGTPGRSKRFLDTSYGRLGDAGNLADHQAVIRGLAARYRWIDGERVGMAGSSGGGTASARAMFSFPETFKVGISDAGAHDVRGYTPHWGESYLGPNNAKGYADAANANFAKGLQGKLLLMHGEMDSNVLPGQTLQVVAALKAANKQFDLLIMPNVGHTTMTFPGYGMARAWDYLTTHLIGATPPVGFAFKVPPSGH